MSSLLPFDPKALLVNVGNLNTILAIGCEYTMKAGEIDARSGNQCDEPGNEIQRFEQDMGRTIAPGCF